MKARGPEFECIWEIQSPASLPEPVSLKMQDAYSALHELLGPINIKRMDPNAAGIAKRERTCYLCAFPGNLAFRADGSYSGPGSICFYGPGGVGATLDECLERVVTAVKLFCGCVAVNPPEPIYGPVRAAERVSLYGQLQPAIDKADKLSLAMEHVLGRVPIDWPQQRALEPVEVTR
jgi:hypothetical protein